MYKLWLILRNNKFEWTEIQFPLDRYLYLVEMPAVLRCRFPLGKPLIAQCPIRILVSPPWNGLRESPQWVNHNCSLEKYWGMTTNPDFYRTLKVSKTFQVISAHDISTIVTQLANYIEKNSSMDDLSVRILLPREAGSGSRAQKWGLSLRSGLILALKRKKIRPTLREVRYVHDDGHYGWLLIDPRLFDNLHA